MEGKLNEGIRIAKVHKWGYEGLSGIGGWVGRVDRVDGVDGVDKGIQVIGFVSSLVIELIFNYKETASIYYIIWDHRLARSF